MKCPHVREYLPLFCGGDLPWPTSLLVRWHLRRCPNCRTALARSTAARSAWKTTLAVPVDDDLFKDLWQRVSNELPSTNQLPSRVPGDVQHSRPTGLRIAAPVMTAAVLLLLVLTPGTPDHQSQLNTTGFPGRLLPSQPVATIEGPVEPGTTVLEFQTNDPEVTIVWFFADES